MKVTVLIAFLFLGHLASALDDATVKKQLLENFNYLIQAQAKCAGDFASGRYICNRDIPGSRRILGSWDSSIIPVAFQGTYPMRFLDSNMFVTAHTLYPLFLLQFEDPELEQQRKTAIDQAIHAINKFQRDQSYAFWPQIGPSVAGQVNRIGPLNLSPLLLSSQIKIVQSIQSFLHLSVFPQKVQWMQSNLDLENKDLGMDVFFSVPNDADDTALGIVSNYLFGAESPDQIKAEQSPPILQMTREFGHYVDSFEQRNRRRYKSYIPECAAWMARQSSLAEQENLYRQEDFLKTCSLDDPRESWRYLFADKHSDAYLTWFYQEKDPIYAHPSQGVSLPGQNSVDCNVLANVLYALSTTEQNKDPEIRPQYLKTCNTISDLIIGENNEVRTSLSPRKIDQGQMISTWKVCGLFYPAQMTFPYLLSKAVAANACQDLDVESQNRFDLAINLLVKDITTEQDLVTPQKQAGEWYEKIDQTIGLPTALGSTALLNLKMSYKEKLHFSNAQIQDRITQGIESVLRWSQRSKTTDQEATASALQEGTFFGGGTVDEIAHWRSQAFSTAVSLELMIKYLLFENANVNPAGDGKNGKMVIERTSNGHAQEQIGRFDFHVAPFGIYPKDRLAEISKNATPIINVKDHLTPATVRNGKIDGSVGFGADRNGTEAIIGVELTVGTVIDGHAQEDHEEVAYYKVKLDPNISVNVAHGGVEEANVQVKFMGVSTKSDFIINDEIGYLPVQYFKDSDLQSRSIYLAYGELNAPVLKINDRIHVNLTLIGKLIGFAQDRATMTQGSGQGATQGAVQSSLNRNSENLGDFSVGLTLTSGALSASVDVETAVGISHWSGTEDSNTDHSYHLGGKISFQFSDRQQLNLVATQHGLGALKDNRVMLQYEYHID